MVVNDKNKFLQKAHMRKTADGNTLVPLIAASISQFENTRRSQDDSATPHRDLGVRVGLPLAGLGWSTEGVNQVSPQTEEYLKALFKLNGKAFMSPADFVKSNIYLLWEVPEAEYEANLPKEINLLTKIAAPEDSKGEEEQLQSRKVSELTLELLKHLRDHPSGSWTEQDIKESIGPLIKSIGYATAEDEKFKPWGWKFLRWVVNASANGPALILSMVILGKEETLARARRAIHVAQSMGV